MNLPRNLSFLLCTGANSIWLFAATILFGWSTSCYAEDDSTLVQRAEAARIAVVERVAPAVVCVFDADQRGGGSGVLIDSQGYGLTNFHVVAGMLEKRRGFGGLSDGKLYEMVVLGVDPTGDVAMFKLLGDQPFAFAKLGDSDLVRVGDSTLAMGNPFVLSEDYTPTVTMGIVTGVHRYQWGEGNNLIYSDCIQTDASINPGNSGGPLFNAKGEVIGINGRISVSTRGRFNVGHGYAITSNQIARFIPSLRAGLLTQHGTPQATVEAIGESLVFGMVKPKAAADRAGVRSGDRLLRLEGQAIRTPNEFASVLGTFPADWPIRLELLRDGKDVQVVAPLDAIPINAKDKFVADAGIGRDALKRTIGRFQESVAGAGGTGPVVGWEWRGERKSRDAKSGEMVTTKISTSWSRDRSATQEEVNDAKRRRISIEFDDVKAVEKSPGETEGFALSPEVAMVFHARYLLMKEFLLPIEEMKLEESKLVHVGGRRWLGSRLTDGSADAEECSTREVLCEVIESPIAGFARARYFFEETSGRIVGMEVQDQPTGAVVRVGFDDYRTIAGIHWPAKMVIRDRDSVVVEEISTWDALMIYVHE